MVKKQNDLYEVKLESGKALEPKFAMVLAKNEENAKIKAQGINRGYRAVEVKLVQTR